MGKKHIHIKSRCSFGQLGASLFECGLCLTLVLLIAFPAVKALGEKVNGIYTDANQQIDGTSPPPGTQIGGGGTSGTGVIQRPGTPYQRYIVGQ